MIAPQILAALLALSAPDPTPSAEPAVEDPSAAAQAEADDAAAAGEEEVNPLFVAVLAKLSAEDAAALQAMSEEEIQALLGKVERGEALAPQEERFATAFGAVFMEQFEAELRYQTGDVTLEGGLATLHLGDRFRYLDPPQAEKILVEAWGNPPGARSLGMIVPADISPLDEKRGWGVIISYAADGYVEDDDADDIDYDELLTQMKEATEGENGSRRAQGYPPMHLVGWAEPPHYDEAGHRLYWAKELSVDGSPEHSLNYSIRVLGRRGVLELNAVAGMEQLPQIRPEMEKVLSSVEFNAGNRYEDFDPDIDSVAAYGIGGLIAGKVLAKAGFFALILKGLLAAKKLLLVVVIGIGVGIRALFNRRRNKDQA